MNKLVVIYNCHSQKVSLSERTEKGRVLIDMADFSEEEATDPDLDFTMGTDSSNQIMLYNSCSVLKAVRLYEDDEVEVVIE